MASSPVWSLGTHIDGESNIDEARHLGEGSVDADPSSIRAALADLAELQTRETLLSAHSGRWNPGQPDPEVFVPGDVAAVRGLTSSSALGHAAGIYKSSVAYRKSGDVQNELNGIRAAAFHASVAKCLLTAVPFFIPETMIESVCSSDPPDALSIESIRLPYPLCLVMFGRDVPLDPSIFDEVPLDGVPPEALLRQTAKFGGFLSGVVLIAENDGSLSDHFLWLLTSNPDSSLPYPANLDRIRGAVIGRRSRTTMAGLVETLAGVVIWAPWSPVPRTIEIPVEKIQKESRHGKFRRWEPNGGLIRNLRVISYQPPQTRTYEPSQSSRRSPREHTRRGHFRRVLVGVGVRSLPSEHRSYETRWIPPTLVNVSDGRTEQVIYRIAPRRKRTDPSR